MDLRPLREPAGVLGQIVDDLAKAHRIHVHVDGRRFREHQGDTIATASGSPLYRREDLPHIDVGW